ncbi:hypothetical protein T11_769 [Trichinella zimbabwensis]|uniref:Uncharacterized protein n=1 Tax=Trichinella zimbabwensis TaxID=268475 RepID=A0A0V1GY06_9BILA|nr:hypothetical protein T11_769 [Trichinella zimbabwensis]
MLKRLSLNCAFETHLPSALRDQFILGLHSGVMKRRLLFLRDLTFEKTPHDAEQLQLKNNNNNNEEQPSITIMNRTSLNYSNKQEMVKMEKTK